MVGVVVDNKYGLGIEYESEPAGENTWIEFIPLIPENEILGKLILGDVVTFEQVVMEDKRVLARIINNHD